MEHVLAVVSYNSSYSGSGGGAAAALFFLFDIALYVATGIGLYGTFRKAGQPGWAGFVPIYNIYIMLKVAGRPTSWTWFVLAPILTFWLLPLYLVVMIGIIVVSVIVLNDVSKSFGKGGGFTVGLVLLPVVFFNILGYGKSSYRGSGGPTGSGGRLASGYQPSYPPNGMAPAGGWTPPQAPVAAPPPPSAPLPSFQPPPASPGQIPSAP